MAEVTKEQIEAFLNGTNPQERIIKVEGDYNESKVHVIYRDENGKMHIEHDDFYPFVWCKLSVCTKLFGGNRDVLKQQMRAYGIKVKALRTNNSEGYVPERMENGFKYMFYATIPMSYTKFLEFFEKGGCPVYGSKNDDESSKRVQEFIAISNTEQYMISTGKRLFKGYNDYDDLLRLTWDLETEGLDPHVNAISQIGIYTNRGYKKIITIEGNTPEEKIANEIAAIDEFFQIVREINPDVITGHNIFNFDFYFIDTRLELAGSSMKDFTKDYFNGIGIYRKNKESVLKLGGEMEYFRPTVFWGHNVTDSLQAVRRAQALDSSMKKADLKYVSAYSKIKKKNRVYIKGKLIDETWLDLNKVYAFNDDNGHWFKTDEKTFEKKYKTEDGTMSLRYNFNGYDSKLIDNESGEEFEFVTGRYVAERYLMDDLWEGDRVEHRYNGSNFLVGKMLPISFEKTCTTGTAALWKYILMAWSYENGLALPDFTPRNKFTGGLSRLLTVGYVDRVVKLDYNSLYPSIILTYGIETDIDIMGVMSAMLEYVLTQRELYKGLKAEFGGKAKAMKKLLEQLIANTKEYIDTEQKANDYASESASNDKKQLPLKILGNSYFGAFGSGDTSGFNWSDINAAEETTCSGRQALRLMISHFVGIGYKPIVGDTDGFNFQMPKDEDFRYNDNNPYISKGLGRNYEKGKAFTKVEADVAEFEDLYMNESYASGINKMGLGIDEYVPRSINFSRKNYADLLDEETGEIKLVGNTIKSKKMPIYIEKFLDKGIRLLLMDRGKEFLELYYDYLEKIYNMQIPLKDIASIGKIKTSVATYKENCKQLTKGGAKKSRQAWYELAIKHNLDVNMGDAIYYINTGEKKTDSDVKRITHYFFKNENGVRIDYVLNADGTPLTDKKGNKVSLTKTIEREYTKAFKGWKKKSKDDRKPTKLEFGRTLYPNLEEEDEILFNCVLLPNNIIDDEDDHFCDDDLEYNRDKYIDMFNKKVKPLLVCFDSSIRYRVDEKGNTVNNILITSPKDRKTFTEAQCKLVSGQPYSATDQDTYKQLMSMDDKEIIFWKRVNKRPLFEKECGMNWDEIEREYDERMALKLQEGIRDEVATFQKFIDGLTEEDIEEFEGFPKEISELIYDKHNDGIFYSHKYDVEIGRITDIIDKFSDGQSGYEDWL